LAICFRAVLKRSCIRFFKVSADKIDGIVPIDL
jgi:hypothetical protein